MIRKFIQRAVGGLKRFVFPGRKTASGVERREEEGSAPAAENASEPSSRRRRRSRRKPETSGSLPALAANSEGSRRERKQADWQLESFAVAPVAGKGRFHDLSLPLELMHGIADQGFQYCTPIQDKALPIALAGHDLIGKANTGTGKSAVFLLSIFTRILEEQQNGQPDDGPLALVIAPTRELVLQIAKDGARLGKYCQIPVLAVYGGAEYQAQERELRRKAAMVVAATPGRLLDFLGRGVLNLEHCRMLVIDEADRMLDMGFIPDVRRIIGRLPARERRQTMLFSATVSEEVQRLAAQWCSNPQYVEAEQEQVAEDAIEQRLYLVTGEEKFTVLCNLLRQHPEDRVLIFANMKSEVRRLGEKLAGQGIDCAVLSGDVPQDKREGRLERFRAGKVKILVATDVAGRGLHIDKVQFVINYTLPYEPEDYVHRIGRTGRAGAAGVAISFACEEGAFVLPDIEQYLGHSLQCVSPEEDLLVPLPPALAKVAGEGGSRPPGRSGRRKKSGSTRRRFPAGSAG